MNTLYKYLIVISLTFLIYSCAGEVYMPELFVIELVVTDNVESPIEGLNCTVLENSEVLNSELTDSNGYVVLDGRKPEKYKYLTRTEYFEYLTVIIDDIDGVDNGGSFQKYTYQVQGTDVSSNIKITMDNTN